MLSSEDARLLVRRHLGDSLRAHHSVLVGRIMRHLAYRFGAGEDLWEAVGLCHDLDFFEVANDWTRHGVLTARRLIGELPEEALNAIAAHDHRTGVIAESPLADMLKVADAAAAIIERLGAEAMRSLPAGNAIGSLSERLGDRAYLAEIIGRYGRKHALPAEELFGLCISVVVAR